MDPRIQTIVDEIVGTGLRPVFCRIGSKRDLADKIIKLFPTGITTYVEPFIGSGAILWAKEKHPKEVINDLDSSLIKDYRLLKTTKARNFRQDLDTVPEIQAFVDKKPPGEANALTYGIVNRCNKWMGKEFSRIIYQSANPYSKLKKIDEYQERLKGVTITNMSYEKVVKKYDSPTTFFYCDPPYEQKEKEGKLYEHGTFDFQKFRDTLAACKGKWLVSINDSKNIRSIFKGFYYQAFTVKGKSKGVKVSGKTSIGGKDRPELLIANYPISGKKLVGGGIQEGLNALAGTTGQAADLASMFAPGSAVSTWLQGLNAANSLRNATGAVLGNTMNQFAPGATNIPQVKSLLGWFG